MNIEVDDGSDRNVNKYKPVLRNQSQIKVNVSFWF